MLLWIVGPTNPQQQHHRIPNAPKRDNIGNRAQQARLSNTGSTSDQATWKRFGLKERRDFTKDLITKEEYNKIREFNKNDNIIIRKADKNNTFVIMDKNEYIRQLTHLLSNPSKFQRINSDPTEAIKRKLNSLIAKANKNSIIFSKITEHFEAGYIYGNPKTHKDKNNPPLRPIVSQVGTVTVSQAPERINSTVYAETPHDRIHPRIHCNSENSKTTKTTRIIRRRELIHKRTNKRHFEHHNRRRVQSP